MRESDARKTAILNAAFDCIVTMDGDGNIVEVNAATERTFGYSAEEMVGRELAELMIPPGKLREDHRRGLRRYMETGASRIVGHPVELIADARRRQHVPRRAGGDAPGPPGPGALLRLSARRDRAPPGRARAARDGRGAGRAASRGDGGRRRGRARAPLRPHRRGGRARARRRHRQHPALQRRRDGAGHGGVERGRRRRSRSVPRSISTATPSPPRSGAPTARRATTASKARPAPWPTSCARPGSRRPSARP